MRKGIDRLWGAALLLLALAGLWYLSDINYLLFHTVVEGFGIIIAFSIFVVAWNTRSFLENHYLLFLGLIYPFVGILDFLHVVAYKGMGVFPGYGSDLPTQLWIQARFLEGASILAAALFLRRKLSVTPVLLLYSVVTALLLISIFTFDIFPNCFVEPAGLTPFKKVSEYVICLLLVAGLVLVFYRRESFSPKTFPYITGSIAATILSELFFTLYTDVYGLSNMVGHLLKILSFYLIYKGLIEVGLRDPYSGMFMDLSRSREELLRARDELRRKNRELESFVNAAGHDLRTPLASAMGYTQLLIKTTAGVIDPEKKSMFEKVLSSLRRLNQLLGDLQDFAHLAKRENIAAPIDLVALLGEILEQKQDAIESIGAEIVYPDRLPDLWMEPTKAYQLFTNLISNSLKFTREGVRSRIEIGALERTPEGSPPTHKVYYVRDNGRGIPHRDLEKVFELFYSSDTAERRSTGAGLAIVRRIVEQGGGRIWVESEPGQGSTFFFTLPVVRDH